MKHDFLDNDICELFHLRNDDAVTVVVNTEALTEVQDDEGNSIINFSEGDLIAMLASIQERRDSRQKEKAISLALSA